MTTTMMRNAAGWLTGITIGCFLSAIIPAGLAQGQKKTPANKNTFLCSVAPSAAISSGIGRS
jgi:hypothetical protein